MLTGVGSNFRVIGFGGGILCLSKGSVGHFERCPFAPIEVVVVAGSGSVEWGFGSGEAKSGTRDP